MNQWMEFAVEAALAALVAYFTSQKTTAVNIAELKTGLEGLGKQVASSTETLSEKVDGVRDELRTYYQRKA